MQVRAVDGSSRISPNSGIAVSSTVRPSGGIGERACFAEVARVVEVLAGGPIRGDLQAHVAVARLDAAVTGADAGRCCCGRMAVAFAATVGAPVHG